MSVVAIARALYAFQGEEEGDLSFKEDEILRILRKDESGWWEGQTDDGRRGDFPYNYVEIIDQGEADRIRTGSRFIGRPSHRETTTDNVQTVKVSPVPNSPRFNVEATLGRKRCKAVKSMEDFRVLDSELRHMFPNFDRPLPPYWADKVFESEQASRKKANVLEIYLQKLVGGNVEVTEFALVSWMNPRESFNCSGDAKNTVKEAQQVAARNHGGRNSYDDALANTTPLARALYNWDATDAVELPLQISTFVAIRNMNTTSPGWWEGETSDGQRGLFPSNYVKQLSDGEAKKVIKGENPAAPKAPPVAESFTPFKSPAQLPAVQVLPVGKNKASNRQRKTEDNFAMPSLDAFDELLLEGFTMLDNNKLLIPRPDAQTPRDGDSVVLSYIAYVWDCQKQRIIEFASSDLPDQNNQVAPLQFIVGKGQTIKALERAVLNLEAGQKSRIIVRPDMGYGEVGNPPSVPPNCHLIYDVTLETFDGSALPGPPPMATVPDPAYIPGFGGGNGIVQDRVKRQNHNRGAQASYAFQEESGGQQYSLDEMKQIVNSRSYNEKGVNPTFLEDQLNDQGFTDAFGVTRAEFMLMPKWKRSKLKQDAGLF